MVVECVRAFLDLEAGEFRDVGDRFSVSADRYAEINGTKYGTLVKEHKRQTNKGKE